MDALRGSMKELGWLKTIIVNKTTGHVLDGHARVEEAMRQGLPTIPATVVELSEDEERLALAVLDPITELAYRDDAVLKALLEDVETEDAGLQALLDTMKAGADLDGGDGGDPGPRDRGNPVVNYIIIFDDEVQQEAWFSFIRRLNQQFPNLETVGEKIHAFIKGLK
jgi:hypothetical protein